VVGRDGREIAQHALGDFWAVLVAAARLIREPAEGALRVQFARAREARRGRMQVRNVGEPEQREGLRETRAYDTPRISRAAAPVNAWIGGDGMSEEQSARRLAAVAPAQAAPLLFSERSDARLARALARGGAEVVALDALRASGDALVLVVRGDAVLDERLVKALLASGEALLAANDLDNAAPVAVVTRAAHADAAAAWLAGGAAPAATALVRAHDLVPPYTSELRKLAPAFLRVATPANAAQIERALFDASYKGVTDFVTKYAWPPLAFRVVRICARLGITPNAVTVASWLLVVLTIVALLQAQFVLGLAAAWAMTFLDTVDGKLARVTLNSSPLGHWLDHGLDLTHPPVWWWAWAAGIGLAWSSPAALVVLGGYLLGRLLEGVFIVACDFEIHSWRRLDSFFRVITARRNPNLALLTVGVLAGSPAGGFEAVAWWTAFSIAFHAVRLVHALALRAAGKRLQPWEEELALASRALPR
jgi:phosphatidylglycerophosphate synthase/molybdopterin-guanine dinucleotide biosynthesis protein A